MIFRYIRSLFHRKSWVEEYLERSTDLSDLERRCKEIDRGYVKNYY